MAHPVLEAAEALRRALADLEPAQMSGPDCLRLANELARTEKACAGARLLAAARAAGTGAAEAAGYRDGADWLARQIGTSTTQAREALRAADRLPCCPATQTALRAGDLSVAQALEIVKTEADAPGVEADLVAAARGCDLGQLRDLARERIQAHHSAEELRRRHHATRCFRAWSDREGMVRFAGALPPEHGIPLRNRVERDADRRRRDARRAGGQPEPFEAYAADALLGLLTRGAGAGQAPSPPRSYAVPDAGGSPIPGMPPADTATPTLPPPPGAAPDEQPNRPAFRADLVIVCDLFAFRRGYARPGEPCHIIGGGPIPVEVAQDWARDAFIRAALHDGTNIHTVCHFGRTLPAALRTALELGPAPDFPGRSCRRCGRRWGLEFDHIEPVAHRGPTAYDNLQPLCWSCHQRKSESDRRASLTGGRPARGEPP
jgi:hypothetical protein